MDPGELLDAVLGDNTDLVSRLLDAGGDIDIDSIAGIRSRTKGSYSFDTPLIAAAFCGSIRTVSLLLDRGADVNIIAQKWVENGTALIAAAGQGKTEMVSLLLHRGADIDFIPSKGFYDTALIAAAHWGRMETASLLLDRGADVNLISYTGFYGTALIAAAAGGKTKMVSLLLDRGADPDIISPTGLYGTPLVAAAGQTGNTEIVSRLLNQGVGVNIPSPSGSHGTALISAAYWGKREIVLLLLDQGADVNMIAPTGSYGTALIAAMFRIEDVKEILSLLFDRGADVNMVAPTGYWGTALIAAVDSGRIDMSPLLDRGADVNINAPTGSYGTALIAAAYRGAVNMQSLLLDKGADVNMIASTGSYGTALMAAAGEGYENTIPLLLDRGADVDMIVRTGSYGTALIAAAYCGKMQSVSLLLDRGADVNMIAPTGNYGTPLIAAVVNEKIGIVSLLLDRGADVNSIVETGDYGTALVAATRNGLMSYAAVLLGRGADIQIEAGRKYGTVLGAAIHQNCSNYKYFSHLLGKGVDINSASCDDGSVLGQAAFKGDEALVSFLLSNGANPLHVGGYYETKGGEYPTALDAAQNGKAGAGLIALLASTISERRRTERDYKVPPPFPIPYTKPDILTESPRKISSAHPAVQADLVFNNISKLPPQSSLTPEQSDLPCRSFDNLEELARVLVSLAGIQPQVAERLKAWIRNDVWYFTLQGYDLGLAYAATRVAWKRFNEPDFNVTAHRANWQRRARSLEKARNSSVYHNDTTMQQLIKQPYQVMPRRIWDVKSNRVVEFRMLHSEHLIRGNNVSAPDYWAVTHSWTSTMEGLVTSINQYEWPVPLPHDLNVQDLRAELQFLGFGNMYIWLDVLCLRQDSKNEALNALGTEEWKVDIPTIGNIYRNAQGLVRYFNGLGLPFVSGDWDDPRHWLKRAWTLQEILTEQRTINGGVPRYDTGSQIIMNAEGMAAGNITTLRRAIQPVLKLAAVVDSPAGCSIYELAKEMGRRVASNPTDKVAGLLYLLHTTELPTYDRKVSDEDAWIRCFTVLPFARKIELLFDFPYRGTRQRWVPTWRQLIKWPDYDPDHGYTSTVCPSNSQSLNPSNSGIYLKAFDFDWETSFLLSGIWAMRNVCIDEISGGYRIKVDGRYFGFFCPYPSPLPIRTTKGQVYTIAIPEVGASDNWVVCELVGDTEIECKVTDGRGAVLSVEVAVFKKIGVLRTDAGGELWLDKLNGGSILEKMNALFV